MIRNNMLLHKKLGLAIQFPSGWQVQNRPDRVVALSPQGDALVELRQGPKHDRPLETLQKGIKLDAGARYDSGSLSGYPAAFAAGAQQGKPVVVAAVVFNDTQYLIAGMTQDKSTYDRERSTLRAAINSFRAMTPAEKQAARPYLLQLVTARSGMTMAGLARQSPLGAEAESQLRLMNDLYPNGEPKPGQLLKIVR
jgi:predicted Zn-dependent protease